MSDEEIKIILIRKSKYKNLGLVKKRGKGYEVSSQLALDKKETNLQHSSVFTFGSTLVLFYKTDLIQTLTVSVSQ